MLDWHGSGQSVMEMSHRGQEFVAIAAAAEADLRNLLAIPDSYRVLFLQGGASLQFEMIPMNLLRGKSQVDYVQHRRVGEEGDQGRRGLQPRSTSRRARRTGPSATCPPDDGWQLSEDAAYVHYTANETIGGVEFGWVPEVGDVPLVSDMSSNILSRPVDVSRFGLIYAGAQKNIGPAGLTIVIIRDDLIGLATRFAVGDARLRHPRQGRLDVQHPADVRDLHRGSGVPAAARDRRAGGGRASATSPRRRCCTTIWTAPTSTPTRSRPRTGPG